MVQGEGRLSRESHRCINVVNIELPGEAPLRERICSVCFSISRNKPGGLSISSLKAEKAPFLFIVAGKEADTLGWKENIGLEGKERLNLPLGVLSQRLVRKQAW